MNLLILTPYIPYPVNSGGNQGFFGLVDRIRKQVNISIVFIEQKGDDEKIAQLQKLWSDVQFHIYKQTEEQPDVEVKKVSYYKILSKIKASAERKIKRLITAKDDKDSVVRKYSSLYSNYYSPLSVGYVDFVDAVLRGNSYDLIQVDFFELITIANILPKGVKKVFIHHELRLAKCQCEYSLLQHPTSEDRYMLNYSNNFELQYLRQYDHVVAMTQVDKNKLDKYLDPTTVSVSPAIVNVDVEKLKSTGFRFNNDLIFLGGCYHYPNVDGLMWFLDSCWGKISQQSPDAKLHVIGKWSDKWQKQIEARHRNVLFLGYIEDLTEYLKNKIMIVPVRIGSGVRIKALDGIVNGTPIVSTTIGVEGLNMTDGQECLIADDAEGFSAAVLRLMDDHDLAESLQAGAKKKMEMYAHPDKLAQCRLDIYRSITE